MAGWLDASCAASTAGTAELSPCIVAHACSPATSLMPDMDARTPEATSSFCCGRLGAWEAAHAAPGLAAAAASVPDEIPVRPATVRRGYSPGSLRSELLCLSAADTGMLAALLLSVCCMGGETACMCASCGAGELQGRSGWGSATDCEMLPCCSAVDAFAAAWSASDAPFTAPVGGRVDSGGRTGDVGVA